MNNSGLNIKIKDCENILDYLLKDNNEEMIKFIFNNNLEKNLNYNAYKYLEDQVKGNPYSRSANLINKILIKKFIEVRDINYLYHFTNVKNLENILLHGILSINQLKSKGINYFLNDKERLDGRLDYISTSISRINSFYLNELKNNNPDEQYCSLILDSSIMYKQNCLFFSSNAARKGYRRLHNNMFTGYQKLKELFKQEISIWSQIHQVYRTKSRKNSVIPKNEPTDIQAEVMIPNLIKIKYIKKIIFADEESYLANKELMSKYNLEYEISTRLY